MTDNRILVDSSFLFAVFNQKDSNHALAIANRSNELETVIPEGVLVETCYLLKERIGMWAAIRFLDSLLKAPTPLESITSDDLARARDIMAAYADARLDFVDCCLMALAERLTITRIYTFDRRDFRLFRPRHCDYLELLP